MKTKRSKNSAVVYVMTAEYVRARGYGSEEPISYCRIPEKVSDWAEPMKTEMLEFYDERYPFIECPVCGKKFRKSRTKKTCSPECSHKRSNKFMAEHQRKRVECECTVCGKTFSKLRYQQKNTCSPECTKAFGMARKGKIDGPKVYEQEYKGTVDRTKKKRKSQLVQLEKEAREKGLTYGQLQAQKYIEEMRKATWQ